MLIATVIGAVLGYMIGGPLGMLIGAALAYWGVQRVLRKSVLGKLAGIQAQFLDSTFAVMGCLCKADGQVTQDELEVSKQLWDRLRLNAEQRERAKAAFNRGKAPDFDLDAELAIVRRITGGQRALLQVFLQVQLSAIAADGVLHPAEHEMLVRVARGLGCSEAEIEQIEAMLRGGGAQAPGAASEKSLEDAYRVLGVDASASDAEIKRAYRRLMSQNHPDKLASKGLPESMREVAKERTSEISNAYDLIKKTRERQAA
ncbi:co-chaperone protein DjlA [Litchfieldella qijiaojingensis]|uniref:Co-chaperone protein DjlA n=1 Tax=Litchfieldella qijiaojingensis TaxID=980347 RepID=A0ABQ2YI71_9GAMM|nr:co-chaperone DjlA [Halomonas qijiaojingensis]GGX84525.1 co-chaperone protein DjlA [Halomonas qijiaojingensis]